MEVNPIQTPISVSMLGKIILAFFLSEQFLNYFLVVPYYFLANNVSPEIAF